MRAIRRTTVWAGVLVAILLAAVVLAPAQGDTRWLRTLHNTAHGPVFGCVALLLLWMLRSQPQARGWSVLRQYMLALAGATALGVATEILQIPVNRDASAMDALNDVLGGLTFLAGYLVIDRHAPVSRSVRILGALICLSGLAVLALPISHATFKYYQREQRFPVLADFTISHDRYFLFANSARLTHLPLPMPWVRVVDESALQIELQDGPYPGWELNEPKANWRNHQTLVLDITNPDAAPLVLTLRVHDVAHNNRPQDRFSTRVEIPGHSRESVRVPLSEVRAGPAHRSMDLSAVAGLIVFASQPDMQGRRMYLSRVWLE